MSPKNPTVIDLYAGVGGLSLGAARAGFDVKAAVEIDQKARETHALNFPAVTHLNEDVAALSGSRLLQLAGLPQGELTGLIGGPPCQGFSEIGLKSATDPRNELLGHFFRLVKETLPAFFVAENVPGVLSPRNTRTLEAALALVPKKYTVLQPIKVIAYEHGVPTTRTRIFFVGYDKDRVGHLKESDFTPIGVQDVRVSDALQGLPPVWASWQTEPQSWRAVKEMPPTPYGQRISGMVPAGIGNLRALELYRTKRQVSGFLGTLHAPETVKRFKTLLPGMIDPISKAKRIEKTGYCPTLRAGTGPDRGSYQAIRPVHPTSPRVITPREAARLQGFPDWFQFHPTKWHSFRQIGNSVSPIVAESILRTIAKAIDNQKQSEKRRA